MAVTNQTASSASALRFYALERARMAHEKREREAYARGEPSRGELAANRQRRHSSAAGRAGTKRKQRPRREDGCFMDESLGADFLRRALGDNDE